MSTSNQTALQNDDELGEVLEKIREITAKLSGGKYCYIYRGESEHFDKVSSNLYRVYAKCKIKSPDVIGSQRAILDKIKEYIPEITQNKEDFEILTQLQHYDCKTNLIDFTTDYLVALFFACDGGHGEAGRVILLENNKEKDNDYEVITTLKTINRVASQKSIFVQSSKGFIKPKHVVSIPANLKEPILKYLKNHHDISHEFIYKDIHGFIKSPDILPHLLETYKGKQAEEKWKDLKKRMREERSEDRVSLEQKEEKMYEKIIGHYSTALKLNPKFPEGYTNLEEVYFQKGKYIEAVKIRGEATMQLLDETGYYSTDIATHDNDTIAGILDKEAKLYFLRGIAHDKKGEDELAIENYSKVIELQSDDAMIYAYRGNVYERRGDINAAIEDHNKAVDLKPQESTFYHGRCLLWIKIHEWEKAEADLDTLKNFQDIEIKYLLINLEIMLNCERCKTSIENREWEKVEDDLIALIHIKDTKGVNINLLLKDIKSFAEERQIELPENIQKIIEEQLDQ